MTLAKAWIPISKPIDIKRLAKLSEELGELQFIVGRILQQGLKGINPKSNVSNRLELANECADVLANIDLNIKHFGLDYNYIINRADTKVKEQNFWGNDV